MSIAKDRFPLIDLSDPQITDKSLKLYMSRQNLASTQIMSYVMLLIIR